jgi:carboxypeptidase Taq
MQEKLSRLRTILAECQDLNNTIALLDWDQQVNMPRGGSAERGEQLGTLSGLVHDKFTAPEVGQLLEDLKPLVSGPDPDSNDARLVKIAARYYTKQVRVPSELVSEFARATTTAHQAWVKARSENDFVSFQPQLEHIFALRRRYADCFAPYTHVYDPLLDDFEPGMTTADVQAIFSILRPRQIELIQAIADRPQIEDVFLSLEFDPQKQWDFGVDAIRRIGFDFERGRQDTSAHPFTTSFGLGDVRITTRIDTHQWPMGFFGTVHETGHALYEQGFDPALGRTPMAGGASLAVHESQSRLWENLVGRSRDFWVFFYPRLQGIFPAQFANVPLDAFYRAINKVRPSLIRTESDEATYNLHIMLRLELEIELMEGSLDVRHLPEAWNERMRQFLGITPPNDRVGVLQDVHWSGGSVGYFPTYALGNLISVQLWEKINQDIPALPDQIRQGEFAALLAWLRENVHRHGAKFEPQELVQRITGSKIDPGPYLRYLQHKFGEIYAL